MEHRQCTTCHEVWPTQTNLAKDPSVYNCTCYTRDKHEPKCFSMDNDMIPGEVPSCL